MRCSGNQNMFFLHSFIVSIQNLRTVLNNLLPIYNFRAFQYYNKVFIRHTINREYVHLINADSLINNG